MQMSCCAFQPGYIWLRTLLLETNGCILLIASYSLLEKPMSYQGVGRHVSIMFPFCQATKNRIQSRVTDRSNRMIWGFLLSPCRFFLAIHNGPANRIELILPERFSFVHYEKHSDIFRTRRQKRR